MIERADAPERKALIDLLYRQYNRGLARYLSARFGKAAPDIEDVVQSTFLKLADHPDLDTITDPRAYIFALACNLAIDNQRKNSRRGAIRDELHSIATASPTLDPSSEKILIDRERLRVIEAALKKMPAQRRRIFLLIRIEGLSVQEVAERFAMSEAAVYKHVARALADCAAMLERADRKAIY
jgi:RNA polymerase sigma-70 factor (ECF subfamily)